MKGYSKMAFLKVGFIFEIDHTNVESVTKCFVEESPNKIGTRHLNPSHGTVIR